MVSIPLPRRKTDAQSRTTMRKEENIKPTADYCLKSDCYKSDCYKSDCYKSDYYKSDYYKSDYYKSDCYNSLETNAFPAHLSSS
ncbi:hypothetical protein NHX12_006346 [Muraenolepis orangiensis]|uniref:Uncharacterized protein n=1 Tax=Muraenolepis orangiensis TaxID=630683 RepID=A0A9Q0DT34_9TELE|nr:hypothetical protein NHX12_006346 [Muraenolepis orangiensis]